MFVLSISLLIDNLKVSGLTRVVTLEVSEKY